MMLILSASIDPLVFLISLAITYLFFRFGFQTKKLTKLGTILVSILSIGILRFIIQGAMIFQMRRGVTGFDPIIGKLLIVSFGVAVIHVLISSFLIDYTNKLMRKK